MAAQGAVGGGAHLPELVIEGTRSPTTRAALAELWLHRGLVLAFAIRDVKVKYKQAILGVAWAVVQPLGLLVLFTLLVARAVTIRETDVPYPAFALSALIPWLFLQNAVVAGTGALLADSALVRKIYFPRGANPRRGDGDGHRVLDRRRALPRARAVRRGPSGADGHSRRAALRPVCASRRRRERRAGRAQRVLP